MTFLDPPSNPNVPGWSFIEYFVGFYASITTTNEQTMKLTFAPGETGRDSGLEARDTGVQVLAYEVYFSGTGGEHVRVPGGKNIPASAIRSPGWNKVRVDSRFVVNGVDVGEGDPTDVSCYIANQPTLAPQYVYLDYFEVEASRQVFLVTVEDDGSGNAFYIDGVKQSSLTLYAGNTYTFDQQAATNTGHPLRLSTTPDGTHNGGIEYSAVGTNGTPGSANASLTLSVTESTPSMLYYYCANHAGMGGSLSIQIGSGNDLSNATGILQVIHGGTGVTSKTGTGSVVLNVSPVLKNVQMDTVVGDVSVTGIVTANQVVADLRAATTIPLANTVGVLDIQRGGTGATFATGTGNVVLQNGPVLANATVLGSLGASQFLGNGYAITSLNMDNAENVLQISHGGTGTTLATGTGSLVLNASPIFRGTVTMANLVATSSISGNGYGLQSLNIANVAGVLPPERGGTGTSTTTGSGSLVLSNAPTFDANILVNDTVIANVLQGNLDGQYVTGTISNAVLPNSVSISGNIESIGGYLLGNGSLLTGISTTNAGTLTSGKLLNNLLPNEISVLSIAANGFPLHNVNAANLVGTIDTLRLPETVQVANIVANGYGLSTVNAANLVGTVPQASLPDELKGNAAALFDVPAANLIGTISTERLPATVSVDAVVANAYGMTSINAANLVGTIDTLRLPETVQVANIVANGYGLSTVNAANLVGTVPQASLPDELKGNAAALFDVPAANLIGTISTERLPATVSVDAVVANAYGMTSINAANLVGTIDTLRLPETVQVANITANGYGLSTVNAANLVGIVDKLNLPEDIIFSTIGGDAAGVSNIPGANIAGTISNDVLPANISVDGVEAIYLFGNGAYLSGIAGSSTDANALIIGTLDNARLPSAINVTEITANGYGLSTVNAANLIGELGASALPPNLTIAETLTANTLTSNQITANGYGLFSLNAANLVGELGNSALPPSLTIEETLTANTLTSNQITANGYGLSTVNAANLVGHVSNTVFTEDILISNTVHANYFVGNGVLLEGVATTSATSLVEGTLHNDRLPDTIQVGNLIGNAFGLHDLNAANVTGILPTNAFPSNLTIQDTVSAVTYIGNGALLEGVATINAATLSEGILPNERLPGTIEVSDVYANFIGNASGLYDIESGNLVGTIPQSVLPETISVDSFTANTMNANIVSSDVFSGNGFGLYDITAANITGLEILAGNASLLTTGEIDQSVLPQNLGNAETMLFGNGVAISNTNAANLSGGFTLDINFPPGSINANALYGSIDTSLIPSFLPGLLKTTLVSDQQAISNVVLVANNIVTGSLDSTRVFLNGTKLASIDANLTDYMVYFTQDLSNTTTTFTVELTNPIGYGDILDVIIETNTSVNANGSTEYYDTVYANTLQVNDISFAGNSVISDAEIELILASGIWSGITGTVSEPAFTFEASNTTGLYLENIGSIGITANGTHVANIGQGGLTVEGNVSATLFAGDGGLLSNVSGAGSASNATLITEGTLDTARLPADVSIATLTANSVDVYGGNVYVGGRITGFYFEGDGGLLSNVGGGLSTIPANLFVDSLEANVYANVLGNLYVDGEVTTTGNISAGGNITAFASDRRLKSNIQPIQNALEIIKHLHGYTFTWRDDVPGLPMSGPDIGLLAQELQELGLDECVSPAPFDLDTLGTSKSGENYLTIHYNKLFAIVIQALHEIITQFLHL